MIGKAVISQALTAIRLVFSQKKYLAIAIITSLAIFLFNIYVTNYKLLLELGLNFKILASLLVGTIQSLAWYAQISTVTLSVLTGITLAMLSFKAKVAGASVKDGSGILGTIFGVLMPGCASCGIGVLAILGFSSALLALPLAGLEFAILGVAILGATILYTSKQIVECPACKVQVKTGFTGRR
jgi:hypothetical protein